MEPISYGIGYGAYKAVKEFLRKETSKTLARPWLAKSAQALGLVPKLPGSDISDLISRLGTRLEDRLSTIEARIDMLHERLDRSQIARLMGSIDLLRKAERSNLRKGFLEEAGKNFTIIIRELPSGGETGGRKNRELKALAHLGMAHVHRLAKDDPDEIYNHLIDVIILDEQIAEEAFGQKLINHQLRNQLTSIAYPPGKIFKDVDEPWCPEMVVVPAGEFVTNLPSGQKVNTRINQAYALGRFSISYVEWDAYCSKANMAYDDNALYGRGRKPVIYLAPGMVKDYCNWLTARTGFIYRLPSEEEWEYACRAGTTTKYFFGDDVSRDQVKFSDREPANVDAYKPNTFGLYQMHGNIYEMCGDVQQYDQKRYITVCRGGSWRVMKEWCQSDSRIGLVEPYGLRDVGFRVLREIVKPQEGTISSFEKVDYGLPHRVVSALDGGR